MMFEIQYHKISKLFVSIFILYILWFKYAYRESGIILYGTVVLSTLFMVLNLLQTHKAISEVIPSGVMINLIICVYSLLTGIFTVQNQTLLMSAIKTYMAYAVVCFVVGYVSSEDRLVLWYWIFYPLDNYILYD